jgi:glycosyltransferase involved in cell wall biosynthesis
MEIAAQHFENPKRELAAWARGPYDVVWVSKATTYVGLGRPRFGPTIVDLDDLEDRKIAARLDSPAFTTAYRNTWSGRTHAALAKAQGRLNARRWARLQRDIASSVDAVIVCSDLDEQRLGVANAVVVPNGYDRPRVPAGRLTVSSTPTVLLQGVLHYPPNADAAAWMATSIAPVLQQLEPRAQVRLVGADSPPQRALHRPPLVTVTGRVPDIVPELARADVVAVPVRFGSGTRVKILEAFAHRIPVVSTSLGAEGIDAVGGEHLLIADTAESFAAACAQLFNDTELRRRLTDNAFDLFKQRYQWSAAGRTVGSLAWRLAGLPECEPSGDRSR